MLDKQKGYYTKEELKKEKAKKNYQKTIASGMSVPTVQKAGYSGPGMTGTSFIGPKKQEVKVEGKPKAMDTPSRMVPKTTKVEAKSAGVKMQLGSKEIDSPTSFRATDLPKIKTASGKTDTGLKEQKRALKMQKLRTKGEAAIAGGNQTTARRLRQKYERQKSKLGK